MITEIEMLKKRVAFLEKTLYSVLYQLRKEQGDYFQDDPSIPFNNVHRSMKSWINDYVSKIGKHAESIVYDETEYEPDRNE
jgi:hypothetical protein